MTRALCGAYHPPSIAWSIAVVPTCCGADWALICWYSEDFSARFATRTRNSDPSRWAPAMSVAPTKLWLSIAPV